MTGKTHHILCALLGLFLFAGNVRAAWDWRLDAAEYRRLNLFERAQYDKAKRLFDQKEYRAAASEFEKFKVQYGNSDILPYVIFMRGYSLHHAKDRHTAIRVYNEVLDYFGGEIDEASAALYFLGIAHFDNGDIRQGMEAMKEMAEDVDYRQHPLAAGAIRRLADNHWNNKEPEPAVKYWKQVVADFGDLNSADVRDSRAAVAGYCIRTADYAAYESWQKPDERDDAGRHELVKYAWGRAYRGFRHDRHGWEQYHQAKPAEKEEMKKAFWEYLKSRAAWFRKADAGWDYFACAVKFLCGRYDDPAERRAVIDSALSFIGSADGNVWPLYSDLLIAVARGFAGKEEIQSVIDNAVAFVATLEDRDDQSAKLGFMIDRLREADRFDHALHLVDRLPDPRLAEWKRYEIQAAQRKWRECEQTLMALEQMGDAEYTAKARNGRARVYKDRLREYEKAIKLYRQIADPPRTLWAIQECYHRWGKLGEAVTTLTEIENSFPDHASRAAWYKTDYYNRAGEEKKAVASARRILKMYPKSKESSYAHQLLEKFGIKTGGGVLD